MSVNLDSPDGQVEAQCSNGVWMAIVKLARAYDERIPAWNGCHDGDKWDAQHLSIMADRLEQTAKWVPVLRELANHGGVVIT